MKQKMLSSKSWISYLWDHFSFIHYMSIRLSAPLDSSADEGKRHPGFRQAKRVQLTVRQVLSMGWLKLSPCSPRKSYLLLDSG